jgi:hypothetical protein
LRYKIAVFILIFLLLPISGCTFLQSTEGPPRKAELAIINQELTRDEEGNVVYLVSVKNISQVTIELAEVKVNFYDSQDNFVGSTTDGVLNLRPDDTWDFYIQCQGACVDIKRCDVEVTVGTSSGIP